MPLSLAASSVISRSAFTTLIGSCSSKEQDLLRFFPLSFPQRIVIQLAEVDYRKEEIRLPRGGCPQDIPHRFAASFVFKMRNQRQRSRDVNTKASAPLTSLSLRANIAHEGAKDAA